YVAIDAALDDVRKDRVIPVPVYLRDKNTSPIAQSGGDGSAQRVGEHSGEKYEYSHNAKDQLSGQDYLGVPKRYYEPKDVGAERVLREYLDLARARKMQKK
ncbi:MAG: hypothetical protein JKY96_07595, partial [Phycisphaerales bacterium]|nr:hypothetical protein [Phycisphaerales bacterium]